MAFVTIKKRKDFLRAAAAGKKIVTNSIVLQMVERVHGHIAPAAEVRIGFTVTKKMGNAVIRNCGLSV